MQSVVDRSLGDNDYDEIIDILNRHKTLVKANVDLQEQQTLAEGTVDNVRTKNAQELTSTQNKILVENSKIHEKQTEIENLKQSNTNMENTIEENAKRSASAKKDAGQVVMSIKNLLNRCGTATTKQKKHKIPKILKNEKTHPLGFLDECMGHIQVRVVELSEIVDEYYKKGSKTSQQVGMPNQGEEST